MQAASKTEDRMVTNYLSVFLALSICWFPSQIYATEGVRENTGHLVWFSKAEADIHKKMNKLAEDHIGLTNKWGPLCRNKFGTRHQVDKRRLHMRVFESPSALSRSKFPRDRHFVSIPNEFSGQVYTGVYTGSMTTDGNVALRLQFPNGSRGSEYLVLPLWMWALNQPVEIINLDYVGILPDRRSVSQSGTSYWEWTGFTSVSQHVTWKPQLHLRQKTRDKKGGDCEILEIPLQKDAKLPGQIVVRVSYLMNSTTFASVFIFQETIEFIDRHLECDALFNDSEIYQAFVDGRGSPECRGFEGGYGWVLDTLRAMRSLGATP